MNIVGPIKQVRPTLSRVIDSWTLPKPIKLILRQDQSPGDIVVFTAAVRDLHLNFPGWFVTDVRTPCPEIFENNPFITRLRDDDPDVYQMPMKYDLIHTSNEGCHHFIHGFIKHLGDVLGLVIEPTKLKGDIYIGDAEKSWISQVSEVTGRDERFWIINCGSKSDYTCKQWEFRRFQEVVDSLSNVLFVQVGSLEHNHKPLVGKNVINLLGKTDLRQLVRLVFHSFGVISPVSLLMHLAAAVEMHSRFEIQT